jgi:hypothetical protein
LFFGGGMPGVTPSFFCFAKNEAPTAGTVSSTKYSVPEVRDHPVILSEVAGRV